MRKDYIPVATTAALGETDFIATHWTRIWEQEGGPQGRLDKVLRQDEYRLMAPHLGRMAKGSRILDGGCGLGDWVLALDREGFLTTGLDISEKTVAQLQHRFPEADFRSGDIRHTNFNDGELDAYFSWGVFEHFEAGPQDCIREAHRILKPGGMLFISVPMDNLRHALRSNKPEKKDSKSIRFYQYRFTPNELARELEIGGFEVLSAHPIHKRQGVLRMLHHDFKLPYKWFLTRALAAALAPLMPGNWISHMVLAVARRPDQNNSTFN
jgi:SAM-dependent methyltransferase